MSPVQPLSARHPLAVVCIVFLPLAAAAAADFLTKKENELFLFLNHDHKKSKYS